jgi:hypothetical protein
VTDLDDLLARQDGVVSRRQLVDLGHHKPDLERMLRRRDLVRVHPGVFVNHTGPLSWQQRAWAAVLYAGRSALHLDSALPGPDAEAPISVAIDATRRVVPRTGLRIHRVKRLEEKARWNLSPPRVSVEVVALEKAHRARDDLAAIAALTDVVGRRLTTAARIGSALADRPRLRRRQLLTALVGDLAAGTHSVLEHGFLTRVVRPHGLPEPTRLQAPRAGRSGSEYRDVEYADFAMFVELDGRFNHDGAPASDRDAIRDLDDLADGQVTPRLRFAQVYGGQCRTAARLARIFAARGWRSSATSCGPGCEVAG